jgi:hypothetical protein
MPNHVENDLYIRGPKKDIEAFFEAVRGKTDQYGTTEIDADKLIPYPKRFADADKAARDFREANPKAPWSEGPQDGYNQGGYEWCVSNWGTKWGFYDFSPIRFGKNGDRAKVSFQTAWSPAFPLFNAMAKKFPTLTFTVRYFERGMGFKGLYKVKGDEVLADECSENYRGNRGG